MATPETASHESFLRPFFGCNTGILAAPVIVLPSSGSFLLVAVKVQTRDAGGASILLLSLSMRDSKIPLCSFSESGTYSVN
jgi:hypothetical protein